MTWTRDEATRLRRCRLLFEQAQAAHCSMEEARRREIEARWATANRRHADRRCGTIAPEPRPDLPAQWWQL